MRVKIHCSCPLCWYFCWYPGEQAFTTNFVIPERWNLADSPQERWRERQGDALSSEAKEIVATLFDYLRDIVDISADASSSLTIDVGEMHRPRERRLEI